MARVTISRSGSGMADGGTSIHHSSALAPPTHSHSQRHLQHQKQVSGTGRDSHDAGDDDDDDAFFTNLTLDGVQEGPYMLCKHADDLLGHHARQVFREKASSMRGDNSIYYYLKELMRKFGTVSSHAPKKQQLLHEPEQLVLEAHAFRKLIASDPAFQCAISSDQVDALFHRIEQDHQQVIRHQDFVEFCLLDHNQLRLLLFKYKRILKKLRLTDNELTDTFRRLTRAGCTEMAPELFQSAISRELDVVLTSGFAAHVGSAELLFHLLTQEVGYMMRVMDYDKDGLVKVSDFEIFAKDDKAALELVHPVKERTVVDIKISAHEADVINNRRDGYSQLFPKLHDDANAAPMYLWFKSAFREEGKTAISNIKYAATSRETDLVTKGFTCLKQDLNRNGAFGKHKYMWLSYAPSRIQTMSEIIDLALTSGDLSDKNDARLWLPPHRGFKLVPDNLNEKSAKVGVFLWLRRQRLISSQDLVEPHIDQALDSPRSKSTLRLHIDDLEEHVRKTLRRNCPIDQDGALSFGRLFDEFDTKKTRGLPRQTALVGIESFGIKLIKKDFALLWDRMNPFGKKQIDTVSFAQFLELNDSEIDDVVNILQRSMTTRSGSSVPDYHLIFQSYNSLNDGKLSRADFQRIFAANQLNFTNSELSKVMQRFDINKDGVVDYADFLRYVTGVCDASSRIAARVFDAAEEIRTWAIEKQNKKLAKDGNIDSTSAWKVLKMKHGLVETASLDHILRQRNVRLDPDKLQLLKILMSPATNGEVNQVAFHSFVNHFPKKIKTMVYDLKKVIGPVPQDSKPDVIFDRLNVEGNGKLSLVNFAKEINALAIEKSANVIDLKDFVYAVEWTGANCGGDGAVLIDRFIATVRETQERRNMKNEFLTHYDSPRFLEGVELLREEIKKCAKTPDGKLNFLIPFRLFDKDNSGEIVLSEFELAIRELGVDKYLSDQEIKSLMRRFDPNSSGAIDYDEFLRFNLAESTSSSSRKLCVSPLFEPEVRHILGDIIVHERLSTTNIAAFCSSLKRMFGILDKETTGCVPSDRFVQTLREMGITIPKSDMDVIVRAFAEAEENHDDVHYPYFCDMLLETCSLEDEELPTASVTSATEPLDLLVSMYDEHYAVQPPGSPNVSLRKGSRSSPVKPKPHELLVARVWKLNRKLRPQFPFERYFKKYQASKGEFQVKKRVFEKVMDKFLSKLTESRVSFNMYEMDIELLTRSYGSRDEATINYGQFLEGLAAAKSTLSVDAGSSSSSSSDGGDLSCSSDEGDASNKRKHLELVAVLGDAIKRARSSKSELKLLRAQLKSVADDWEKSNKHEKVSENKIYKLLTKFTIRLRKKEAELLLSALVSEVGGKSMYDVKRFFKMLDEVLATELDGSKAGKEATTQSASSEKPSSSPVSLSATLAEKIYCCFLTAAQKNISGRKLLEKCDPKRTGSVTVLEFQTVLRLMGCTLSESELEQVKEVLGNDKNSQLSYLLLVEQISKYQQQARKDSSMKAPPLQRRDTTPKAQNRPPWIQIPSGVLSPGTRHPFQILTCDQPAGPVKSQPRQVIMSREEILRVDSFLRPFFSDLLQTRNLSRDAVIQRFEAYDIKGTGFVSVDAFNSVMRKLDIWLPADVSPSVLARFTSRSGKKFDFVDFCHVVCHSQDPPPSSSRQVYASSLSKLEESRAPATSRGVATQGGDAAPSYSLSRRLSFTEPMKLQRSSISLPSLDVEMNSGPGTQQGRLFSIQPTATSSSGDTTSGEVGWRCPVCFHAQTRPTSTCEICAAQNPASVVHELLLQCSECAFRNKPSAAMCELCRLPLRSQKVSSFAQDQGAGAMPVPESPKKMQLKLPLKVSYDEGWLT